MCILFQHSCTLIGLKLLQLLLLFVVTCNESSSKPHPVDRRRGGNFTFECNFPNPIKISLTAESKEINDSRVFRNESLCIIIIKNLTLSDAGRYTLTVHLKTDQTVVDPQDYYYQLHIHDEITLNSGENLTLDIPPVKVNKIEHEQTERKHESNISTPLWREVEGVLNKQLTNENLTIPNITESNAGTYRFLDSKNNILITVTVKVNGSNIKDLGKTFLGVEGEQPSDNRTHNWIILPFGLIIIIIIFLIVAILIIKKRAVYRESGVI
ncbi:uncharacterized protein [Misgurnus anguillicaudatus]|uniref:uncharacterized protein n=1 Tax=Misgurnus anguillicaudatus TaxID=75329 RepID=UPI003CCF6268